LSASDPRSLLAHWQNFEFINGPAIWDQRAIKERTWISSDGRNTGNRARLIPGHNGQLTIVANVEELWVVFQLLLLAFIVSWDQFRMILKIILKKKE